MTLKQRRLRQTIKHSKSLFEAAVKAGYSPYSRTIYQPHTRTKTNQIIAEALGEDAEKKIKGDFELGKELALKNNDLTNFNRSNEGLARIVCPAKTQEVPIEKEDNQFSLERLSRIKIENTEPIDNKTDKQ